MESLSVTHRVVRNNKRLPQSRYSPYTKETNLTSYEKQKEEAVRLGVDLSLSVAEAMFLLSDDMRSMLLFCLWLLKYAGNKDINAPVVGRELDRFVLIIRKYRESSLGVVVKPSDFEHYNQELKKLEETLRSSKDISAEANGFAREAIKSNILYLWKSLFETSQPKVINPRTRILEMFRPLFKQPREDDCSSLIASLHI
ncbi:PREDICTED: uncharacterized protein LOC104742044 [Camelina sativa]|uniref:Uncharacterized protein LOC104742044 n=1 Tax=Camelina sativa TaxID=90675 RepID=A0ABM1QXN5_CAMSA|nr:PREDICTED: uncharacterized protein LOC104742044 [Camelina sativa]